LTNRVYGSGILSAVAILLVVSCTRDVLSSSKTTNEIDVFLLIGQSNMVGHAAHPSSIQVTNAYYYWNGSLLAANDPVGLADSGSLVPAFCENWCKLTGRKILVVPAASDGAPQTAALNEAYGVRNTWDTTGFLFDTSVARLNAALMTATAAGYTPVLKGVLEWQGETDSRGINDHLITQATFINAKRNMIRHYRINYPYIPFYMIRIGTNISYSDAGFDSIRQAQQVLTDSLTNIVYWGAIDFKSKSWLVNNVHATNEGLNEAGKMAAKNIFNLNQ
jgi:hypothetical protein